MVRVWSFLAGVLLSGAAFALPADLRGVNLNLSLETERFWRHSPSAEELSQIHAVGFNAVRVPLRLPSRALQRPELLAEYLERVQAVLTNAKALGFFVVVDLHDRDIAKNLARTGVDQAILSWRALLSRPAIVKAIDVIEPLNEPFGAASGEEWTRQQLAIASALRGLAPGVHVALSGAKWNEYESLSADMLPTLREHVVTSFHYYAPMAFTHKGATWISSSSAQADLSWSDIEKRVRRDVSRVEKLRASLGVPIYLGEFGVIVNQTEQSRAKWLKLVSGEFRRLGVGWFLWSYSDDFGAFDARQKCWRPQILAALGLNLAAPVEYCQP